MEFSARVFVFLVLALSLPFGIFAERSESQPNIIIFYVDDMGYADPSCFGNPDMETPHIDRFASEGLKLTNYYSNSPICSPSRVALNTGQAPGRHGVWAHFASKKQNRERNMVDYLDPNVQTMAKSFKAKGYATAHFGKWHMGGGRDVVAPFPQAYGFQESLVSFEGLGDRILFSKTGLNGQSAKLGRGKIDYVEKYQTTGIYVDRAIDFMKRHQDDPFYLHVFPNDVHDRHEPHESWMEKYERFSDNPFTQQFYAVLDNMDREFGRLVDAVDDLGLGESTIIIFTSDNGPTDWPLTMKPALRLQDGQVTCTAVNGVCTRAVSGCRSSFAGPGEFPLEKTNDTSVVATVDLFPSLHALVDTVPPRDWELDGFDMSAALRGETIERRARRFWEYAGNPGILKPGNKDFISPTNAIRDGDWKLLTNDDGTDTKLFNLKNDIGEQENVAERYPERTAKLKAMLLHWRRACRKPTGN